MGVLKTNAIRAVVIVFLEMILSGVNKELCVDCKEKTYRYKEDIFALQNYCTAKGIWIPYGYCSCDYYNKSKK
jgi:hypothetical protein